MNRRPGASDRGDGDGIPAGAEARRSVESDRPAELRRPPEPVDAATVVLVRFAPGGLEVLLTRRPDTMAFAPGRHVFPGGSVHRDDHDPRLVAHSRLSPTDAANRLAGSVSAERAIAFHTAALRELFEETGLLLADPAPFVDAAGRAEVAAGSRAFVDLLDGLANRDDPILRTDLLVPIARWVTPSFLDRRFDTWFFAAPVDLASELSFDPREVADGTWIRPSDALDAMASGRMLLWLPTSTTLQRLASVADLSGLARLAAGPSWPPRSDRPGRDIVRLRSACAAGVPGREASCYLVGRRELVVVDPGDPTEEVLDALRSTADEIGGIIRAIVVTSADPDRIGGCEALRGHLGVAVFGPPGAVQRVPFEVVALEDGQRVPFVDVELRVHAVPSAAGAPSVPDRIALAVDGVDLGDALDHPIDLEP